MQPALMINRVCICMQQEFLYAISSFKPQHFYSKPGDDHADLFLRILFIHPLHSSAASKNQACTNTSGEPPHTDSIIHIIGSEQNRPGIIETLIWITFIYFALILAPLFSYSNTIYPIRYCSFPIMNTLSLVSNSRSQDFNK